ncbi:MAG: ABC-type transport auxiliary lipoprotein family protein [Betaproteobacteria bacterium]
MRTFPAAIFLLLLSGCSALKPAVSEPPKHYSLAAVRDNLPSAVGSAPAAPAAPAATTLIVSPPHASAGFDSHHIMYLRQPGQLEHFAYSEWVDTPARMLAPMIVSAIQDKGAFRAVVQTPSPATGEMRLDTEILQLQQEFFSIPSRVRFGLRVYLVENATRRVIATREFEATVASASEDPQGGVVAAGRAVQSVLEQLAVFCAEAALNRR